MLGSTVVHGLFANGKYALKLSFLGFFLAAAISDKLFSSSFSRRNECLEDKLVHSRSIEDDFFLNLPCVRESTGCLKHQQSFKHSGGVVQR